MDDETKYSDTGSRTDDGQMVAQFSLVDGRCILCDGELWEWHRQVAHVDAPDGDAGYVCAPCFGSIVRSDDPSGWLLARAEEREARTLRFQHVAERLRRLNAHALVLPGRELLAANGYGDDDIPF